MVITYGGGDGCNRVNSDGADDSGVMVMMVMMILV